MKSRPEIIELDEADLLSRLDQIEALVGTELVQPIRQIVRAYAFLLGVIRDKTLSIRRLHKMLFGRSSERTSDVLPPSTESSDQDQQTSAENPADHSASDPEPAGTADDQKPSDDSANSRSASRRRRPGHGRIPASAYTGCEQILVTHEFLSPGDACPDCGNGPVYRQRDWSLLVRLKGPNSGRRSGLSARAATLPYVWQSVHRRAARGSGTREV